MKTKNHLPGWSNYQKGNSRHAEIMIDNISHQGWADNSTHAAEIIGLQVDKLFPTICPTVVSLCTTTSRDN